MTDGIGGVIWNEPAAWAARCDPRTCPICQRGAPEDVLLDLDRSWVVAPPRAPLPGYVAVFAKAHAVEPFHLPAEDRRAFWDDALLVAAALSDHFRSIKMNYEIHGNTIPHLHLHLFPRFREDPHVGGPIDSRKAMFVRTREDLDGIRAAIQRAFERERGHSSLNR